MNNIRYPSRPWSDGQVATLMPGMDFIFSSSLKKWVPITPGTESKSQLQESFGVSSLDALYDLFNIEKDKLSKAFLKIKDIENDLSNTKDKVEELQIDISNSGRIWKSNVAPDIANIVNDYDIWIDSTSLDMFYYDFNVKTWVQLN